MVIDTTVFSWFFVWACTLYIGYVLVSYLIINHWPTRPAPGPAQPVSRLSIIIPALNEAEVIQGTITSLMAGMTAGLPGIMCELIVVDDGSQDDMRQVLYELESKCPCNLHVC